MRALTRTLWMFVCLVTFMTAGTAVAAVAPPRQVPTTIDDIIERKIMGK